MIRKGPSVSATVVRIGTVMRGNDGALWHVKASGKSQRWVRVAKSPVKKSPTRKSPTRKSPVKKSPAKKSPVKGGFSVMVTPYLFDNETVHARTARSQKLAVENIDKIKAWYKKHVPKSHVVSVDVVKNKLRLVFDQRPTYLSMFVDPDDDGNYPVRIDGKTMLVSGKIGA